jgi:hypothetical protein
MRNLTYGIVSTGFEKTEQDQVPNLSSTTSSRYNWVLLVNAVTVSGSFKKNPSKVFAKGRDSGAI